MALSDPVTIPPRGARSVVEWEGFVTRVASRAITHTRLMLKHEQHPDGAWRADMEVTAARAEPANAVVRLTVTHRCGRRYSSSQVVDRMHDLRGNAAADAIADVLVAGALRITEDHMRSCSMRPPRAVQSVTPLPQQIIPMTATHDLVPEYPVVSPRKRVRKSKPKAKACVLCGAPDDQFPEWNDDCNHTPKERKGK